MRTPVLARDEIRPRAISMATSQKVMANTAIASCSRPPGSTLGRWSQGQDHCRADQLASMKGTPGGCTGVEFSHRRAVLGDQEHFARGRHLDPSGQGRGPCRVRRRGRGGAAPPAKPVSLPIPACADIPSTPPLHQPSPNRQDLSRQLIREPQQAFAH